MAARTTRKTWQTTYYRGFTPAERRRAASMRRARRPRLLAGAALAVVAIMAMRALVHRTPAVSQASAETESIALQSVVLADQDQTAGAQEPVAEPAVQAAATLAADPTEGLDAAITAALKPYDDLVIGVSVIDLASGKQVGINDERPFIAASTTKMIAASLFLKQVEDGTRSLDEKLGGRTAAWQLQQLVNRSNNASWDLFNGSLTFGAEEAYMRSIGLASFDSSTNSIAPKDTAQLLARLYKGELLNQEHTGLLLSHMLNTNEEGLLPPGIAKGTKVYHKYGEFEDKVHDAAVVAGPHPYVLAVYSDGQGEYQYDRRAEMIQAVARTVDAAFR